MLQVLQLLLSVISLFDQSIILTPNIITISSLVITIFNVCFDVVSDIGGQIIHLNGRRPDIGHVALVL